MVDGSQSAISGKIINKTSVMWVKPEFSGQSSFALQKK
jgi:hypothetical protein